MAYDLEALLQRFVELADNGPFDYPWCHHHAGAEHGHHTVVSMMVHGNEYGSLPAAVRLLEALDDGSLNPAGPFTLLLGNPEAARVERRFIDSDLNRAWAFVDGATGHEAERAKELQPILDTADLLLDLHQTILDSETPFWIFPWNDTFGAWARVLGTAPVGLTRQPGQAFAGAGLKCVDEYVRERGRPGFCVELGRKGFDPEQDANAERTIRVLLDTVDRIVTGKTTLTEAAADGKAIDWYTTVHQEPWGANERALAPGLMNWSTVEAGVDLSDPSSPPIVPEHTGVVLFPKYPPRGQARPSHQYHLAIPMQTHPSLAFAPKTATGTAMTTVLDTLDADIEQAFEHETQTGYVHAGLLKRDHSESEALEGVKFVKEYVSSVPRILREALDRSAGTFAEDKMARMVEAATAYWREAEDVIPDDKGLIGILDDAYCCLTLVAALESRFHEQTGNHLVGVALNRQNEAVRNILGKAISAQLDDWVEEALSDATLADLLNALQKSPPPVAPPPMQSVEDESILKMFGVL